MGLVCRAVEEAGIATVCVSTGRDLTAQVKPPRSVFVNHPMGNPFGRPGDQQTQRDILLETLGAFDAVQKGGEIIDLPHVWGEEFAFRYG